MRNQKFPAISKTPKLNFVLEAKLFLWTKRFIEKFWDLWWSNCMHVRKNTRES